MSTELSIRDAVDDAAEAAAQQIARLVNIWRRPASVGCEIQEGQWETRYRRFNFRLKTAALATDPIEIANGLRDMLSLMRDPGAYGCALEDGDAQAGKPSRLAALLDEAGAVLAQIESALRRQTRVTLLAETPPLSLLRKLG